MRRILLALAGALLLAALFPAQAGAQDDASVTIVDASTYDIDQPFESTFCFDGDPTNMEVGDIVGPDAVPAGTYDVEYYSGFDQACGGTPDFADTVTLAAGDDVTLLIYWNETGRGVSVLDNDTSCVEPGTGRMTLRHGADVGTVDLVSDGETLIEGVDPTDQGAADLDAGEYTFIEVVEGANIVAQPPDQTLEEGQNIIFYIAGGNDGDTGAFIDVVDLEVCTQPTTTVTAPPVAPAAQAARLMPAFTG
jgi:hypothetical protein